MKKLTLWAVGGLTLAAISGLAGLAHLSATLITLTVFCAVPALSVVGFDALSRRRGRE